MNPNFIVLAALFGLMYFMLIRPQKKQMEARKNMMDNLAEGDIISTIGGIKGKIVKIMEDAIILEIAENVNIEILKSAVGQVITEDEDDDEYEDDDFEDDDEDDDEYEDDEFEDDEDGKRY